MAQYQDFVERCMQLAEQAYPGLKTAMADGAPEDARKAMFELAELLSFVSEPRVLRPWPNQDAVVGVVLARVKRDGSPYTLVMRTHVRPGSPHKGILVDGLGPSVADHVDGFRFTVAFAGLLRLLERQARAMKASDDWSWFPKGDPDTPPGEASDPYWHPDEMVRRVRRWREEAQLHLTVHEVHAL